MKYRNYKRSFRNGVANALYFAGIIRKHGTHAIGRRRFKKNKRNEH